MKTIKIFIDVIAVNLTVLTLIFIDVIPKANAEVNFSEPIKYGLVPLNEDGSVNVTLSSFDVIDVNIEEIGGGYVSYGGPISVEIE